MGIAVWIVLLGVFFASAVVPMALFGGNTGHGELGQWSAAAVSMVSSAVLIPIASIELRDRASHSVGIWMLGTWALLLAAASLILFLTDFGRTWIQGAIWVAVGGCVAGGFVMLTWAAMRALDGFAHQLGVSVGTAVLGLAFVVVVLFARARH